MQNSPSTTACGTTRWVIASLALWTGLAWSIAVARAESAYEEEGFAQSAGPRNAQLRRGGAPPARFRISNPPQPTQHPRRKPRGDERAARRPSRPADAALVQYQDDTSVLPEFGPSPDQDGGSPDFHAYQPSGPTPCASGQCSSGACGGGCCCGPCNPGCYRTWVRAEYLLWSIKGFSTPALVSTSALGTDRADAGVLGTPGSAVLFGGNDTPTSAQSGGRIRAGYWIDQCASTGIEVMYMGISQNGGTFTASSPQQPILARPFFNVGPGAGGPDAELVAYPGLFAGNISVFHKTSLQGAEVLLRRSLRQGCNFRIDVLTGWRYNRLDDQLSISDQKVAVGTDTGLALGTMLTEFDRFHTVNTFNGGVIGVAGNWCRCGWFVDGWLKLALGNNHSSTTISGQATSTVPLQAGGAQVTTTPAGLLAQGTNIGTFTQNQFAVIPELGLNLSRQLSPRLRATCGYTVMYWSRVIRPGDQVDTNLNLTQLSSTGLSGTARPVYPGIASDVWAQGLNLGLDYRF